ncbi:MAG: hypothetical protein HYY54_04640 [candidate division NC10 bacterium]|nr:hypothetical protein [candidate division NC10 bacterium]
MKATPRQWALLGALVLLWAGLLLARGGGSAPSVPTRQGPAAARTDARAVKAPAVLPRLRTDLLRVPRAPLPERPKNLFAAVVEPPPPPPAAPKAAGAPTPPTPPPDPFLEGLKGVKFLGFAREDGRTLAFLSRGSEFLMARETELFLNQYVVTRIGEDSIVLATPDGTREARLNQYLVTRIGEDSIVLATPDGTREARLTLSP